MKKAFLLIGLAIATMASAQVLNVQSVEKLNIPKGDVKVAGISQDGSFVLLTTSSNTGLTKYVLATGEATVLSEATGAGYNAQIATDGAVIFNERKLTQDKTFTTQVMKRELNTTKAQMLVSPTRSARKVAIASNLVAAKPVVSIEDRQLMLTIGGTTTTFSPLGTNYSYIWPSVSPDGKKVLFYVAGKGAYVSDLSGKNVTFLGRDVRAPKWYNNNVVIGMNDQDNGEVVISSEIVAVNLQGQKQVLTQGINAEYPYAANGKIVCTGFEGETYMITVK